MCGPREDSGIKDDIVDVVRTSHKDVAGRAGDREDR
jgi:hypothetical protein